MPSERELTSEDVARIIYDALRRDPKALVLGEPRRGEKTLVDGHFYLTSVARRVLTALRKAP